jgi:hypothetical protein
MGDSARRQAGVEALNFIQKRLALLLHEAREQRCLFFKCSVELRTRALPIEIAFSNGLGRSYRRSLTCARFFRERDVPFRADDAIDLMRRIENTILKSDGFEVAHRVYAPRKRRST